MKKIYFYRDLSISFKEHVPLILCLGVIAPFISWHLINDILGPNGAVLTLIILCWFMVIVVRRLYYLITDIFNFSEPTLFLSEDGLDYPYLLKQPQKITWSDIENIEYIVDKDKSEPAHSPFILLTIKSDINIEKFKRVYVSGMQRFWKREYYDRNIIVIFEESLRGYSVKDAADRITTYWKCATKQINVSELGLENYSIQYVRAKRIQFLIVSTLLIFIVLIAIMIFGITQLDIDVLSTLHNLKEAAEWQDLSAQAIKTIIWLIIVCIFGTLGVMDIFKKSMIGMSQHTVAINFNYIGITCINDKKFDHTIVWNEVKAIYIKELIERKTSKKVPVLEIEMLNTTYRIYNELENINIYELYELMISQIKKSSDLKI